MKVRILTLLIFSLILAGCSGPLGKYDADRDSESSWEINKKPLVGLSAVKYKADLVTKGSKFRVNMSSKTRDPMTGASFKSKWVVRCNGSDVWITDQETSIDGSPFEKSDAAYHWKVDKELLRQQLFWKSNFMAGEPQEKGTEKIDGKEYKILESVIGNSMGGSTKYTYLVDDTNGTYKRLSREFVGDKHVDTYDCVKYKGSTSVADTEFVHTGPAEDIMKFDMFNESL